MRRIIFKKSFCLIAVLLMFLLFNLCVDSFASGITIDYVKSLCPADSNYYGSYIDANNYYVLYYYDSDCFEETNRSQYYTQIYKKDNNYTNLTITFNKISGTTDVKKFGGSITTDGKFGKGVGFTYSVSIGGAYTYARDYMEWSGKQLYVKSSMANGFYYVKEQRQYTKKLYYVDSKIKVIKIAHIKIINLDYKYELLRLLFSFVV